MSTTSLYGDGLGDHLVDPTNYPESVQEYLNEERLLLERMSFDCLVEVGCMDGRYLEWAVGKGKQYLGIDLVERYLEAGRTKLANLGLSEDRYKFLLGNAEELDGVLKLSGRFISGRRSLLVFPFNSFGNMDNPRSVLAAIKRSGLPAVVFSYGTDSFTTAERRAYYIRSGFPSVEVIEDESGVILQSEEGLRTVAYRSEFLRSFCNETGLQLESLPFAKIGVAHLMQCKPACL